MSAIETGFEDDDCIDSLMQSWDSLRVDGHLLGGNAPVPPVKISDHSVTLTLKIVDESAFGEFNRMVKLCDRAVTLAVLLPFWERRGILYRGPDAVGTTRPGPRDNRLRRFVRRGGQLVEVRARGRSGKRGLQAAADV